jgi:hypothetical protein
MYTLDASVHVSAVNPHEPASTASQALLRLIHERQIPLYCPTLLPVEVAAAVTQQYGTTLITLDRQQLERLPPVVSAVQPAAVVALMAPGS